MNPKTKLSKEQVINLLSNAALLTDRYGWVPVQFDEKTFTLGENSEETPKDIPQFRNFYFNNAVYEGESMVTFKEDTGANYTFKVLVFADEKSMNNLVKP